jgi:hypothetical protein
MAVSMWPTQRTRRPEYHTTIAAPRLDDRHLRRPEHAAATSVLSLDRRHSPSSTP